MLGIPGEVNQDLGLEITDDVAAGEEVDLMPGHTGVGTTALCNSMNLMASFSQGGKRMTPDEARGAG